MSDTGENVTPIGSARKLGDAIRDVKNANADRGDVVVEMREAARHRLEMLVNELRPVIEDVPADEPYFDFAISSGLQPRFWIDAVSHVSMGRDRRTYRFVRETRLGPVVLAESPELSPVADRVTTYIAERVVEREQLMEGSVETVRHAVPETGPAAETKTGSGNAEAVAGENAKAPHRGREFLFGVLLMVLGALMAAAVLAVIYRDRLPALGIGF